MAAEARCATAGPRTFARRLPASYFAAVFVSLPVWWLLGVGEFMWPILVLPLIVVLARSDVRFPRHFVLWLAFVAWVLLSATQLEEADRWLAFFYRGSIYAAATVVFLYVFNASPSSLPTRTVLGTMVALFALVVAGGHLGALFPETAFTTPAARLVPSGLEDTTFVRDIVHVEFAGTLLAEAGSPPRPRAPFTYANQWGTAFLLLCPFVVAARRFARSRLRRHALDALLALSVVPAVLTGNRGVWLALAVAAAYLGARFLVQRNIRAVAILLAVLLGGGLVTVASPLGGVAAERLDDSAARGSIEWRLDLYSEAIDTALESPLLGFGAPRPSDNPYEPSIGTHGHVFLLLVAHGVPALLLFFGWLVFVLVQLGRHRAPVPFWMHVVVLLALLAAPYYELLPLPLLLVMTAAALGARELATEGVEAAPAEHGRVAATTATTGNAALRSPS